MLDSPLSTKRPFSPGRYMVYAFIFISFFILISLSFIFITPSHIHYSLQEKQSQIPTILSRLFTNSTPQFSQNLERISRKDAPSNDFSSSKDEISKKTNGVSLKATPSNGPSSNYDFSAGKNRSNPSDEAQVSKKQKGYSRKIKSPKGYETNNQNEAKIIEKVESLRNSGVRGSVVGHKGSERRKKKKGNKNSLQKISHCKLFKGRWVKDDRHPLYKPGSCPFIDESFNCFLNGKRENAYERYRWQPDDCDLPRWNGKKILRLLRGKRLVYVGDSLNRNMWESMVCMLRNSVHNKRNVYEASHRLEFRSEGSYSFVFRDYNFSVEFFSSPFLVQEWEMPNSNGSRKETLRLDLIDRSSDLYKNADILVFNTGHWWTHEKTSAGKGYYQEGDYIYDQLDVMDAFKKAMNTWTRWLDTNVNLAKTLVFFRGYSSSHFSGGQWNSGGQCDGEKEPFKNEKDLPHDNNQAMVEAAETVLTRTKVPIFYLNVTQMSEYRKDAHPSIYIKPNMSDEERKTSVKYQDCSHWCLPGVPDTWNEIVYTQLLLKYEKNQHRHLREHLTT